MEYIPQRPPENAPGRFFVNDQCLDCDSCRSTAPEIFGRNEAGYSFVLRQPATEEEIQLATKALHECPQEAIEDELTPRQNFSGSRTGNCGKCAQQSAVPPSGTGSATPRQGCTVEALLASGSICFLLSWSWGASNGIPLSFLTSNAHEIDKRAYGIYLTAIALSILMVLGGVYLLAERLVRFRKARSG